MKAFWTKKKPILAQLDAAAKKRKPAASAAAASGQTPSEQLLQVANQPGENKLDAIPDMEKVNVATNLDLLKDFSERTDLESQATYEASIEAATEILKKGDGIADLVHLMMM